MGAFKIQVWVELAKLSPSWQLMRKTWLTLFFGFACENSEASAIFVVSEHENNADFVLLRVIDALLQNQYCEAQLWNINPCLFTFW